MLPSGLVNHKKVRQDTQALLALFEGTYKYPIDAGYPVLASLPPDEKQIVEILKAISFDPRLIILDEATASLDSRQVQRLFELVSALEGSRKRPLSLSRTAWKRSSGSPTAIRCCATARPWARAA